MMQFSLMCHVLVMLQPKKIQRSGRNGNLKMAVVCSNYNSQLLRGARNLKPGGKLVYSTCSIDPIENEAVVAQLLRNCPWLELISIDESNLPNLKLHQGLGEWEILDDDGFGVEITGELPALPTLSIEHLAPSLRSKIEEESDKERENWIKSQLENAADCTIWIMTRVDFLSLS